MKEKEIPQEPNSDCNSDEAPRLISKVIHESDETSPLKATELVSILKKTSQVKEQIS